MRKHALDRDRPGETGGAVRLPSIHFGHPAFAGELEDFDYPAEQIAESMAKLPKL